MKTLSYYINAGYTIVVGYWHSKRKIEKSYPNAIVTVAHADGIGGRKLLVDSFVRNAPGVRAAVPKFKKEDVVYEQFTTDFVDGKESNSFFDEMHEWPHNFDKEIRIETNGVSGILKEIYKDYIDHFIVTGNCKAEPVGLLDTVKPAIGDFNEELRKVCEQKMKETMKEKNQKEQVVDWLTTTINNLEVFKSEIEKGKINVTNGSYENCRPVPLENELCESNLSLSIDYVHKSIIPPGQNF